MEEEPGGWRMLAEGLGQICALLYNTNHDKDQAARSAADFFPSLKALRNPEADAKKAAALKQAQAEAMAAVAAAQARRAAKSKGKGKSQAQGKGKKG